MQSDFLCVHKKNAKMLCIDSSCFKYPFDCADKKCCPNDHSSCQKVKVDKYLETINEGAERIQRISSCLKKFYQELISELQKDLNEWEEEVKNVLQ